MFPQVLDAFELGGDVLYKETEFGFPTEPVFRRLENTREKIENIHRQWDVFAQMIHCVLKELHLTIFERTDHERFIFSVERRMIIHCHTPKNAFVYSFSPIPADASYVLQGASDFERRCLDTVLDKLFRNAIDDYSGDVLPRRGGIDRVGDFFSFLCRRFHRFVDRALSRTFFYENQNLKNLKFHEIHEK